MALERLQKILARAGIASRRKAEELIAEGLVTINGKVAKLGDKADPSHDAIKVSGKLLRKTGVKVYYAFNKPKGVISMFSDPQGRPTLADYVDTRLGRLFPVGRLDFNSEGLLLLTNDGSFAERLQRKVGIAKAYHVKVRGHLKDEDISKLRKAARVEGRLIEPHSVKIAQKLQSKSLVEIVVTDPGALDIKSFFEHKGYLTERIVRMSYGHLGVEGVKPGHCKQLRPSQAEALVSQPELGLKKTAGPKTG